jgi:hypothetical protein
MNLMFERKQLKNVLRKPMDWFERFGDVTVRGNRRHIYIDRGSKILGVAHLDTVQRYNGYAITADKLWCSTVDNRMGAYMVLYGLHNMGIECDVLLTDMEEIGQSTAEDFAPPKQYNWMFSFDRGGDDVVMYDYYEQGMADILKQKYKFSSVSRGSYSDIAYLYHAGCRGFNFGCGMYNYHSQSAYVALSELAGNSAKFSQFYQDYKDIHLTFDRTRDKPKRYITTTYYSNKAGKLTKKLNYDYVNEYEDYNGNGLGYRTGEPLKPLPPIKKADPVREPMPASAVYDEKNDCYTLVEQEGARGNTIAVWLADGTKTRYWICNETGQMVKLDPYPVTPDSQVARDKKGRAWDVAWQDDIPLATGADDPIPFGDTYDDVTNEFEECAYCGTMYYQADLSAYMGATICHDCMDLFEAKNYRDWRGARTRSG